MRKFTCLLRVTARVLMLLPVLLGGVLLAATVLRRLSYPRQRQLIRAWSRWLLAVLGVEVLATRRTDAETNGLLVSNHVSWLDAFVLGAEFGAKFVVRADVADWPLVGGMVKATGALFVERASARSVQRNCEALAERLASGQQFAVFPEGTTSDGRAVLAFRPNFFEASLKRNAPVTVVALRYQRADGAHCTAPNYDGELSFMRSVMNVLSAPHRIVAAVTVTTVLRDFECRKQLALSAESAVRAVFQQGQPA